MENLKLRKVLVPMDFSKHSLNALDTAITICQQQNASLTLIHVIDNVKVIIPSEREVILGPTTEIGRLANENLNVLSKSLSLKHSIETGYAVEAGIPSHAICAHARNKGFDMIIIGTKYESGFRRAFTETIPYEVVKNSPCPVLSVPSNRLFTRFKKVVFPVRNAPRMLDKYDVVKPIINSNNSAVLIEGLTKINDVDGFRKVSKTMDALKHRLGYDHVTHASRVHFCDSISDGLLQISSNEKPDLIVIVALTENSPKRFFLEYYARSIVSKASCPVLSLRSDMR